MIKRKNRTQEMLRGCISLLVLGRLDGGFGEKAMLWKGGGGVSLMKEEPFGFGSSWCKGPEAGRSLPCLWKP